MHDEDDYEDRPQRKPSGFPGWLLALLLVGGGICGLCVLGIVGAVIAARTEVSKPNVIVATDGVSQVTIPGAWGKLTELNEKAEIQVGNAAREQYLIVLTESKSDFAEMDLNKYAGIVTENLSKNLIGGNRSEPKPRQVQGKPAVEYTIRGSMDNLNISYWVIAVEGRDHYHQIVTWTLASQAATNESVLRGVVDSFQERVQ